tara:strand:- start:7274 stop:8518 length:1245 start_codon:yes stop_codon:yes gene_type:complete
MNINLRKLPILLIIFSLTCLTNEITLGSENRGFDKKKLAKVDKKVQQLIDEKFIAGAVTLVARDGKIAHFEAHGVSDINTGKKMKKDTIFRIYSMTKPITTAAVMMLAEDKKLSITDPVSKFLPEFKNLVVFDKSGNHKPAKKQITIVDLMRHTSGLTYGFVGGNVAEIYKSKNVLDRNSSLKEMMKKVSQIPLEEEPGKVWRYSIAIDVLGRLVEVVSGKSFGSFLKTEIFEPLGMKDTDFFVPKEKWSRFTNQNGRNRSGELFISESASKSVFKEMPKNESGGGGLCSTASDYFKFCQMILNGGEFNGKRLLKKETVRLMLTNHLPPSVKNIGINDNRKGVGFGYGFGVRFEESDWGSGGHKGECGWGGAASTHFWMLPKEGLVAITLRNFMPYEWTLEKELKTLIYEAMND